MWVRPITADEAARVSHRMQIRGDMIYSVLFLMQFLCGPRVDEALALNVKDVFERSGTVRRSIWFKRTKNGEPRSIPVPSELLPPLAKLAGYLNRRGQMVYNGALFVKGGGLRITRHNAYYHYRLAYIDLGMSSCGTHSPRKGWATLAYEHYARRRAVGEALDPLKEVADTGGWKSIDACARYIGFNHANAEACQSEINAKFETARRGTEGEAHGGVGGGRFR